MANKPAAIWLLFAVLTLNLCFSVSVLASTKGDSLDEIRIWRQTTADRTDLDEREQDLRLEFIDRLVFQAASKWVDQDAQTFFKETLAKMSQVDQLEINRSMGSQEEFLSLLSQAFTELLEPHESPLSFIENYLEFSGISEPATVDQFAETRNYSNGQTMIAANPTNLEEAAQAAAEVTDLMLQNSENPTAPSSLP